MLVTISDKIRSGPSRPQRSRRKPGKNQRLDRQKLLTKIAEDIRRGASMKKILTLLTMLILVTSCLVIASAQTRRKRNTNINNRGGTRTGGQQRSAIGAGGAGTYASNRRGRWATKNGKRIWVPQGSPSVYEREREAELKNQSRSNTNRP